MGDEHMETTKLARSSVRKLFFHSMRIVFAFSSSMALTGFQHSEEFLQDSYVEEEKGGVMVKAQLTDQEADEIIAFLKKRGIEATKLQTPSQELAKLSDSPWEVYVEDIDAAEAIIILDEAQLPTRSTGHLFEEYLRRQREQSKMGFEEKKIAGTITDEIGKIKGVNSAELYFVSSEPTDQSSPANLADLHVIVYVDHNGILDDPNSEEAMKIRKLVLDNIPDLKEKNLVLITERSIPAIYQRQNQKMRLMNPLEESYLKDEESVESETKEEADNEGQK